MGLKKFLVFVKDMTRRGKSPGRRVGRATPGAAVGADQAQIAHVVSRADGSQMAEFFIDVALPEIGGLEDVHVAV